MAQRRRHTIGQSSEMTPAAAGDAALLGVGASDAVADLAAAEAASVGVAMSAAPTESAVVPPASAGVVGPSASNVPDDGVLPHMDVRAVGRTAGGLVLGALCAALATTGAGCGLLDTISRPPREGAIEGGGGGNGGGGRGPNGTPDLPGVPPSPQDLPPMDAVPTEVRRLSKAELVQTYRDLIDPALPVEIDRLVVDESVPFDNDVQFQHTSAVLIEGVDAVAEAAALWTFAHGDARARVLGCSPNGPDDDVCFMRFVVDFGRRAWRRPLTAEEAEPLFALQAESIADDDFDSGAVLALQALLSHPALLYRFEVGVGDASGGVVQLTDHEIATRMAYLLTGSTPDDALLTAADDGMLVDPQTRLDHVNRLLESPAAQAQVARFHAMWLGYDRLDTNDALLRAMRAESDALVQSASFSDGAQYSSLLGSDRTFVDATLATHYGLPAPSGGAGGWVSYSAATDGSLRQGILSHASVLAYGTKRGDSSPTRRGKFVRERLLCEVVKPPPPTVNVDEPPVAPNNPNACKQERLQAHAEGSCVSCHQNMDPIGFGLENYDAAGVFRTHDIDRPECTVSGDGDAVGLGTFNGPAGLSDLIMSAGVFPDCVANQVFRFALGRKLDDGDVNSTKQLGAALSSTDDIRALLRRYVVDDSFAERKESAQ